MFAVLYENVSVSYPAVLLIGVYYGYSTKEAESSVRDELIPKLYVYYSGLC